MYALPAMVYGIVAGFQFEKVGQVAARCHSAGVGGDLSGMRASGPNRIHDFVRELVKGGPQAVAACEDPAVEIATQRAASGLALPSSRPGISRNWRRTSSII